MSFDFGGTDLTLIGMHVERMASGELCVIAMDNAGSFWEARLTTVGSELCQITRWREIEIKLLDDDTRRIYSRTTGVFRLDDF